MVVDLRAGWDPDLGCGMEIIGLANAAECADDDPRCHVIARDHGHRRYGRKREMPSSPLDGHSSPDVDANIPSREIGSYRG